jgi:hypothetical protein
VKRNPWNEIESGHHYLRAMAVWALLPALCGMNWSAVTQRLRIHPRIHPTNFRSFFSSPQCYGEFHQSVENGEARLEMQLIGGTLELKELEWTIAEEGFEEVHEPPQGWRTEISGDPGTSILRVEFVQEQVVSVEQPFVGQIRARASKIAKSSSTCRDSWATP